MKIRRKIFLYFSAATILLSGVVLLLVYSLFSANREEEFQQRLNDKIIFSAKFLNDVQQTDRRLLDHMDRITINDLYQEKMLLFDKDKKLIYASLDDTKIQKINDILATLSPEKRWVETKEERFDVVGTFVHLKGGDFYGIYKAYDSTGYKQMRFLAFVLLGAFGLICIATVLSSLYISHQISSPVNIMAKEIEVLNFDRGNASITVPPTNDEFNFLARKFNELMKRLALSFSFQKHAVHHISHELKTPISVLVSNFEKIEKEQQPETIRVMLADQKERTLALGEIINALLEMSKVESGNASVRNPIRIDELLFDVIDQLHAISPGFIFRVVFPKEIENEQSLILLCNERLMHIAFTNLLVNCIHYSDKDEAVINLNPSPEGLQMEIVSEGAVISAGQRQMLFHYFFRGDNSVGSKGFGLGLVMVQKIIDLHGGTIAYDAPEKNRNIFSILFKK